MFAPFFVMNRRFHTLMRDGKSLSVKVVQWSEPQRALHLLAFLEALFLTKYLFSKDVVCIAKLLLEIGGYIFSVW